jgi:hypothetical protein
MSVAFSGSENARQDFRQTQNYVRRFEKLVLEGAATSRSPLRVRPMEESRKSSLSFRTVALPKPLDPCGCASIG